MAKKTKAEAPKARATEILYTKEKILTMKRYEHRRDLVGALLMNTKVYSLDEVDARLEDFMKGKVI